MADIDHFKQYNDKYGHLAGDKLLAQIGKLMLSSIRGTDVACRYGGEEFTIFLPEASPEDTYKRAEDLSNEISNLEIEHQGEALPRVTISMGISMYPDDSTNTEELLRIADSALYKAKREGRNRVVMSPKH